MTTKADDFAYPSEDGWVAQKGLTKREYFAALAMQSYLATYKGSDTEHVAAWAVQAADKLIYKLNEYESTITK